MAIQVLSVGNNEFILLLKNHIIIIIVKLFFILLSKFNFLEIAHYVFSINDL